MNVGHKTGLKAFLALAFQESGGGGGGTKRNERNGHESMVLAKKLQKKAIMTEA